MRVRASAEPERLVIDGDHPVTYGELDRWADQLAHGLRARVPAGERVAFRIEDFPSLVAVVVAVKRAGNVSVPIDPRAPVERVAMMLEDVEAALLIDDVGEPADAAWPSVT